MKGLYNSLDLLPGNYSELYADLGQMKKWNFPADYLAGFTEEIPKRVLSVLLENNIYPGLYHGGHPGVETGAASVLTGITGAIPQHIFFNTSGKATNTLESLLASAYRVPEKTVNPINAVHEIAHLAQDPYKSIGENIANNTKLFDIIHPSDLEAAGVAYTDGLTSAVPKIEKEATILEGLFGGTRFSAEGRNLNITPYNNYARAKKLEAVKALSELASPKNESTVMKSIFSNTAHRVLVSTKDPEKAAMTVVNRVKDALYSGYSPTLRRFSPNSGSISRISRTLGNIIRGLTPL